MDTMDFTSVVLGKETSFISNVDVDMLWNQDVDMGIAREFYEPLFHEKQLQQQQQLAEYKKNVIKQDALCWKIDEETGERIPTTSEPVAFPPLPNLLQTQISRDTLKRELEELTSVLNFDELDKYLLPEGSEIQQSDSTQSTVVQPAGNTWFENGGQLVPVKGEEAAYVSQIYSDMQSMETDIDMFSGMHLSTEEIFPELLTADDSSEMSSMMYSDDTMADFKPFIFSGTPIVMMSSDVDQQGAGSHSSSSSTTDSSRESNSGQTQQERQRRNFIRDEQRCLELNIPFTVEVITNSHVDEFNALLRQHTLTDDQLNLIKDIRRRGKNKVAAQNCRKKKMHELSGLEEEIEQLRQRRQVLVRDKEMLQRNKEALEIQMNTTYADVFNSLTDAHGRPYDPMFYRLQITDDGEPQIVPNSLSAAPFITPSHTSTAAAFSLLDLSMKG